MKKLVLSLFIFLALFSLVSAIELEVKKSSSDEVVIMGSDQPTIFSLNITNLGNSGNFDIYNLIGFNIQPKSFSLLRDESKTIDLVVYPREDLNQKGFFSFEYFIKEKSTGEDQSETLTLKLIELGEAFSIGSETLSPETNSIEVFIQNKVNFNFNNLNVNFNSAFFDRDESFSLAPYEKKNFKVELNKEDFEKLRAGFYTLNAEVGFESQSAKIEGTIKFEEKDILTTVKRTYGILINTQIVQRSNEGNVVAKSETIIDKNIISRLFTSFSPEPDIVDRKGLKIHYTWSEEINPGENFEITVRTNWFIPFLIIFFIVTIVFFAKQYSKTNLSLKKRVSFVKAKGGEFALKISIIVNSKAYVNRVNVVDRLPPLMKIYDKFGGVEPIRIDEKTKRIEWELGNLDPGETRVLSYVVYSKLGVSGKFALSKATAVYEKEGQIRETESNRAFVISEQRGNEEDI